MCKFSSSQVQGEVEFELNHFMFEFIFFQLYHVSILKILMEFLQNSTQHVVIPRAKF